jgi:hypothetical protein
MQKNMFTQVTMPTNAEIEERARKAYFRLYGRYADQPGWVEIQGQIVTLGNLRGPLARFRLVPGKHGFRLHHIEIGRGTGVCR